jgi:hypothetical protein
VWPSRRCDTPQHSRIERGRFKRSQLGSASDRITASVTGDLPGVSRAIWTAPREAERQQWVNRAVFFVYPSLPVYLRMLPHHE